jgi:carboxylesterase type B
MWSNGPGVQPKSMDECQEQFDELLNALNVPDSLSSAEKIAVLRSISPRTLIRTGGQIKHHQFRAVSDGAFVRTTLFNEIDTGLFAQRLRRRKMKLLIGECANEHFVYGLYRTPGNSWRPTGRLR